MEVKYSSALNIDNDIISSDLPFRASKYSKYINGIFHLEGKIIN